VSQNELPDAHDAKVVALIGANGAAVMSGPASYPPLRADLISVALAAGKTCRVKATAARILIYREGDDFCAVATELLHGGYRRAYKAHRAPTVEALVTALATEYSA
jgi:hypothetical protein